MQMKYMSKLSSSKYLIDLDANEIVGSFIDKLNPVNCITLLILRVITKKVWGFQAGQ